MSSPRLSLAASNLAVKTILAKQPLLEVQSAVWLILIENGGMAAARAIDDEMIAMSSRRIWNNKKECIAMLMYWMRQGNTEEAITV